MNDVIDKLRSLFRLRLEPSGSVHDIGDLRSYEFRKAFSAAAKREGSQAQAAAESIRQVMLGFKPEALPGLYHRLKYVEVHVEDVADLSSHPESLAVHLLGVASLTSNGYVREAALTALGGLETPEALRYIMLRLSDWVPVIRDLAHTLVRNRINERHVGVIIRDLVLLEWMDRIRRADLSPIKDEILSFFRDGNARAQLIKLLDHDDYMARLRCFSILENEFAQNDEVVERAMKDSELAIRLWIAKRVRSIDEHKAVSRLEIMLSDRSARVRATALAQVDESLWPVLGESVMPLLFSKSASSRDWSQYLVSKHGGADLVTLYRERLAHGKEASAGALFGLAETGDETDREAFVLYLDHPASSMRQAALLGIARLGTDSDSGHLVDALGDATKKVRNLAQALIIRKKRYGVLLKVRALLRDPKLVDRTQAFMVVIDYGGWEALDDLLWLLVRGQEHFPLTIQEALLQWTQRSATLYKKPDPELLRSIKASMKALDRRTREQLQDVPGPFPSNRVDLFQQLEFIVQNVG